MSTSSIASAAASSASDSAGANGLTSLSPQDFLQMLITELQDQDPTQPVSNTEILQEMRSANASNRWRRRSAPISCCPATSRI